MIISCGWCLFGIYSIFFNINALKKWCRRGFVAKKHQDLQVRSFVPVDASLVQKTYMTCKTSICVSFCIGTSGMYMYFIISLTPFRKWETKHASSKQTISHCNVYVVTSKSKEGGSGSIFMQQFCLFFLFLVKLCSKGVI